MTRFSILNRWSGLWSRSLADASGQSLLEAALVLPVIILLAFGVVELGAAIRNQYTVTRLSREGSNLISRDTSLQTAETIMTSISATPVDFNNGSTMILSVLKRGSTVGSNNYNQVILYQRHQVGNYSATSKLATVGGGSFGGAPDYIAANSDTDTNLRVTNVPTGYVSVIGELGYVTEIYSTNTLMTPLAKFGITVPQVLYSVAYF
jgi:Flp pilus assembly protein TadG